MSQTFTFTIYTKGYCRYCTLAKQALSDRGLSYLEISLDDEKKLENFKQAFPNCKTVPQVINHRDGVDSHIGGYTDLMNWLSGES